ncbi:TFIIH subunit Tfb4/p34 [Globomyces pollinis-pini]|nr:TFIIH subunit Tfb4/p34 [Globomyces pollinis-pini]
MDSQIDTALNIILSNHKKNTSPFPKLTGAISLGLAYCNRKKLSSLDNPFQFSILIISSSPDDPSQYIPMMNAIFAAQRADIPIDVCRLSESNSIHLPQAAHLTNGLYTTISDTSQLIHHLLYLYLSDVKCRQHLNLPKSNQVDFRATCFCHKQHLDLGFVCSVCLSIFCKPSNTCTTCGTQMNS